MKCYFYSVFWREDALCYEETGVKSQVLIIYAIQGMNIALKLGFFLFCVTTWVYAGFATFHDPNNDLWQVIDWFEDIYIRIKFRIMIDSDLQKKDEVN